VIPVMSPSLPTAEELLPYLRRMDRSHWYSNFGPLYDELVDRFADYFAMDSSNLLLVANGTLALQAAIATTGEIGDRWALPSWTFAATGHAIVSAQRIPHFVDVDATTWCIAPRHDERFDGHLIVAPFGDRPQVEIWSSVRGPKVFDAASCFDSCAAIGRGLPDDTVIMISLHATKPLPAGEGAILLGPSDWIRRARTWSNFGFLGRRVADVSGSNAKMSEYHCAVAMASLDGWQERSEIQRSEVEIASRLSASLGLHTAPGMAQGFISNTWNIQFEDASSRENVVQTFKAKGIESRTWWPTGLHEMLAFNAFERDDMKVTEGLSVTTLGLPCGTHLSEDDFSKIAEALAPEVRA